MRRNTDEVYNEQEYQVCGEDFATYLVVALDVLRPVMMLMHRLQELQQPPWKLIPWIDAVLGQLGQMQNQVGSGARSIDCLAKNIVLKLLKPIMV